MEQKKETFPRLTFSHDLPFARWVATIAEFELASIVADSQDRDVMQLVSESKDPQKPLCTRQVLASQVLLLNPASAGGNSGSCTEVAPLFGMTGAGSAMINAGDIRIP